MLLSGYIEKRKHGKKDPSLAKEIYIFVCGPIKWPSEILVGPLGDSLFFLFFSFPDVHHVAVGL